MAITHFSNVDWIVAWDAEREGHTYLRGGDLAFDGNAILYWEALYRSGRHSD